jgi:hypothetical protein
LFGYLEVDRTICVGIETPPTWALSHPHFAKRYPIRNNRVYVARRQLSWNPSKPGWGMFQFDSRLRLSFDITNRRSWRLPGCFHPDEGCELTYNRDRSQWGTRGKRTNLRIPARGQEFVCSLTPRIAAWVQEVINNTPVWSPGTWTNEGYCFS